MTLRPFAIGDEDLHAFVDGELKAEKHDYVAAALATCPAEQAKVETWLQQNALLRATFAPVAQEPLPPNLCLAPHAKILLAALPAEARHPAKREGRPHLLVLAIALGLGICIGFGGTMAARLWPIDGQWSAQQFLSAGEPHQFDAKAIARKIARAADQFLPAETAIAAPTTATADSQTPDLQASDLQAPDLTALGLHLSHAAVLAWKRGPAGCFTFHGQPGPLVLCLVRLSNQANSDIRNIGSPAAPIFAWQDATKFYALSGALDADRLAETAVRIRTLPRPFPAE